MAQFAKGDTVRHVGNGPNIEGEVTGVVSGGLVQVRWQAAELYQASNELEFVRRDSEQDEAVVASLRDEMVQNGYNCTPIVKDGNRLTFRAMLGNNKLRIAVNLGGE